MARITWKTGADYAKKLEALERNVQKSIIGPAIYDGAKIVTDAIRENINSLPTGKGWGNPEKPLPGPPQSTKDALLDALGITPMRDDRDFGYNVKIGFDGYTDKRTKHYPKGLPIPMLARAVESGTSFMQKNPFVRPAVNQNRNAALKAIEKRVDDEIKKIMK